MARHKSALKRAKQNEKQRQRNAAAKSAVKTAVKKVLAAVAGKDKEGAKELLSAVIPKISKAGAKGIFHKRNASRKISRLTKKVNALGA
ncbi:MAG TPA: 30S ribosomal protein S20 [Syntrophales bacterium]|nr:30S ribosomal protein S20 [Syntrophales bacterium]HOM07933.1 30S ribosomal protein S20 [Syntrophales bacterium]HOO00339.1 30S ribosomal protein S20 [Syntrophales bacterium]HPC01715.1 30S ribosomal protein S20 [Syntrophales bacterium]HPQ06617.1 30S ribosomal protein S20 [Syntrophales bacterium]